MSLVEGQIGPEAKYVVEFVDAKLVAKVQYEGELAGASTEIHLGAKQVLEALKKAIPGVIDDMLIDAAEKALGL